MHKLHYNLSRRRKCSRAEFGNRKMIILPCGTEILQGVFYTNNNNLVHIANEKMEVVMNFKGLTDDEVEIRQKTYGKNELFTKKKRKLYFKNSFNFERTNVYLAICNSNNLFFARRTP